LFPPVLKTKYLVLFPKFAQAMQAVVMDYYTWALAERLYGPASTEATVVVCIDREAIFSNDLLMIKSFAFSF